MSTHDVEERALSAEDINLAERQKDRDGGKKTKEENVFGKEGLRQEVGPV